MPPRFQRPYPQEFRREAVRLVETSGRSIPQVAAELGVRGNRCATGCARSSSIAASATMA